jgi:hypothetical protein
VNAPTPIRPRGTESPEYEHLPRWFFNACERYVENRELIDEPFFCSMLTSDVKGIVQGADDVSQTTLYLMLKYLYNHVPAVSFGSESAVGAWLRGQPVGEENEHG